MASAWPGECSNWGGSFGHLAESTGRRRRLPLFTVLVIQDEGVAWSLRRLPAVLPDRTPPEVVERLAAAVLALARSASSAGTRVPAGTGCRRRLQLKSPVRAAHGDARRRRAENSGLHGLSRHARGEQDDRPVRFRRNRRSFI